MRGVVGILAFAVVALVGCTGSGNSASAPPSEAPSAPPSQAGAAPGSITFGTILDSGLVISDPATSFDANVPQIAWSAVLKDKVGATSITLVFASVAADGSETVIQQTDVPVSSPDFNVLGSGGVDLATLAGNAPGTYVLRYIRGGTVLAEGEFALTGPASS